MRSKTNGNRTCFGSWWIAVRTVVSFKCSDQAQVDKLDESVEWVWSINKNNRHLTLGDWMTGRQIYGRRMGTPNDKWNKWLIPDFLGIWSKKSNANLLFFFWTLFADVNRAKKVNEYFWSGGVPQERWKREGIEMGQKKENTGVVGRAAGRRLNVRFLPAEGFYISRTDRLYFSRCLFLP